MPSDGTAPLLPYFTVSAISSGSLKQIDVEYRRHLGIDPSRTSSIHTFYQCTLLLPLNCPLRDELIGLVMPSKRLAKQHVSLYACTLLHQLGELDDQHLRPHIKSEVKADVDVDFSCELEQIQQKSDYYRKGITQLFDGPLTPPFYLYLITYELVNNSNPQENFFNPNRVQRRMGFLSSRKLPPLNSFGLYSPIGRMNVGFLEIDNFLRLDPDDIKLCHRFQQFVFEKIIELTKDEQYNTGRGSYLIVPIDTTNNKIDMDFINEQLDSTVPDWHRPSPKDGEYFKVFGDAVVISHHSKLKRKSCWYYVNAVHPEVTPLSPFPKEGFATYLDYFRDRYNVEIANLQSPLLEVSKESLKTFNFITPK